MAWQVERENEPVGLRERERRLTDLILSGVIGQEWPQYYMQAENLQQRIDEILQATAAERMPWIN
jgi:flagellar biosynthesis chaperone FliJ